MTYYKVTEIIPRSLYNVDIIPDGCEESYTVRSLQTKADAYDVMEFMKVHNLYTWEDVINLEYDDGEMFWMARR